MKIKRLRNKKKLTQAALAKKVGVSRVHFGQH
jgi:DNA-binding XRE family transcriptional regulator